MARQGQLENQLLASEADRAGLTGGLTALEETMESLEELLGLSSKSLSTKERAMQLMSAVRALLPEASIERCEERQVAPAPA